MSKNAVVLVIGLATVCVSPAHAQSEAGSGARVLGLGGAATALRANAFGPAANPAGLAGLSRPTLSGAASARGSVTEALGSTGTFVKGSDGAAQPSYLGLAWPLRRLVLGLQFAERRNLEEHSSFEGTDFEGTSRFELNRRRVRLTDVGLSVTARVSRWLDLGGSLGRSRFTVKESSRSMTFWRTPEGPTPAFVETGHDGRDDRTSLTFGALLHHQETFSAGFTWRRGTSFRIPYSRIYRFPSLGLEYPGQGANDLGAVREWRAGVAYRPTGRLLLAGDYANLGPVRAVAPVGYGTSFMHPALQSYGRELGVPGFSATASGEELRTGAEYQLRSGRAAVWLRGGYTAAWEGSGTTRRGTLGLGFVLGQRIHVDLTAAISRRLTQAVLSASLGL